MFDQTNQYKKFSLELVENTDDEIFNAINEMIKFRKGEFKFDKNLQNKFKILSQKKPTILCTKFFVSEYFIKKNQNYLIEMLNKINNVFSILDKKNKYYLFLVIFLHLFLVL